MTKPKNIKVLLTLTPTLYNTLESAAQKQGFKTIQEYITSNLILQTVFSQPTQEGKM